LPIIGGSGAHMGARCPSWGGQVPNIGVRGHVKERTGGNGRVRRDDMIDAGGSADDSVARRTGVWNARGKVATGALGWGSKRRGAWRVAGPRRVLECCADWDWQEEGGMRHAQGGPGAQGFSDDNGSS